MPPSAYLQKIGFNDKSCVVDLKKGKAKEGESFQTGKLMDLCTPTGYIPQMKAGKMSPTSFIGNNNLLPTGNFLFYLAAGTTSSHQRLRPLSKLHLTSSSLQGSVFEHKNSEFDAVDPKTRHNGKLEIDSSLQLRGVNWTSLGAVYIYRPLNYNPVEEWFFHSLKVAHPIPIPNSGLQITQPTHVKDLLTAFVPFLGNEKASKQVSTHEDKLGYNNATT